MLSNMNFTNSLILSAFCILIVFAVLVSLFILTKLTSFIIQKVETSHTEASQQKTEK